MKDVIKMDKNGMQSLLERRSTILNHIDFQTSMINEASSECRNLEEELEDVNEEIQEAQEEIEKDKVKKEEEEILKCDDINILNRMFCTRNRIIDQHRSPGRDCSSWEARVQRRAIIKRLEVLGSLEV